MSKIKNLLITLLIVNGVFSQEQKEQSKMLDFVSKTGVIIKFEDYELSNLRLSFGVAKTKIRKVISGNEVRFFFQILSKGEYGDKLTSIAYEDLLETQIALSNLKIESEYDVSSSSAYLENKFVTEDGFQVGYYVKKGKVVWYLNLENQGGGNTLFAKDFEAINNGFQLGKEMIEKMKS